MPINNIFISAAIITFNEEKNLPRCLASLSWVDEIVVVDSCSSDNTRSIATSNNAKVICQSFLGHVKQKQLAVDNCSHDWVISLDADEEVSDELRENIRKLFEESTQPEYNGYQVSRRSFHLGRWIMHGGWYPDRGVRLFNRQFGRWEGTDPHDRLVVEGSIKLLQGDLKHYVFKDLSHNVDTNNRYSSISARILHEINTQPSLFKLFLKPPGKFLETYIIKKGFLDGIPGFIISVGAAYSMFLKQAKLWEHRQKSLRD